MSLYTSISIEKLSRLVGTANAPALIEVRADVDFAEDPRTIPGALRHSSETVSDWARTFANRSVIVICRNGHKYSEGVAAWVRHSGVSAGTLDGGFEAWKAAKLPLVPASKLPLPDAQGRTVWVTRSRPKIDRIACPWLIRRFAPPEDL